MESIFTIIFASASDEQTIVITEATAVMRNFDALWWTVQGGKDEPSVGNYLGQWKVMETNLST